MASYQVGPEVLPGRVGAVPLTDHVDHGMAATLSWQGSHGNRRSVTASSWRADQRRYRTAPPPQLRTKGNSGIIKGGCAERKVKHKEHPELAAIPHTDRRFLACSSPGLKGVKTFRVTKTVAGSERVLVVTYNPKLAHTQWLTLQNDITKASQRLAELQGRLADRAAGLITGGKRPTLASVQKQCRTALRRQHLQDVIQVTVDEGPEGLPRVTYELNAAALQRVAETHLGKTILISNRKEWSDAQIIAAYRSQYLIEAIFKDMKDRTTGSW